MSEPLTETLVRRVGLRIVSPEALVIRRRRCGRGFIYLDERGRRITDARTLERIRSLAVPPGYRDVHIAPEANAHIQAIGRDEAGRVQYRYHPDWVEVREAQKVGDLSVLARVLPRIRARIRRDLQGPVLSRETTLAAIVTLIDRTHMRIGCEDYVHSNRARGAATLTRRNMRIEGDCLLLTFRGKNGQSIACEVVSPELAKIGRRLLAVPGSRLFRYRNGSGVLRAATAADVNAYLREVAGAPITAKMFRTLAATAAAGTLLGRVEPATSRTARQRQIAEVMRHVASMLGNTPAVARKSYVHRQLVEAFENGGLARLYRSCRASAHRSRGEALVAALFAAGGRRRNG